MLRGDIREATFDAAPQSCRYLPLDAPPHERDYAMMALMPYAAYARRAIYAHATTVAVFLIELPCHIYISPVYAV